MPLTRPTQSQFQNSPAADLVIDELADAIDALGLNVKTYGAAGDGSANDTTEINDAIAALAAGVLYFPPGTYIVDAAALNLKSNVHWVGAGMGASIIKLKDAGNGKFINYTTAADITNLSFRDLTFDGNKTAQTDGTNRDDRSGLFAMRLKGLQVVRCEFMNVRSGASIRLYNCENVRYGGCYFHDNGMRATITPTQFVVGTDTTMTVDSTTGFATSGRLQMKNVILAYTGTTATSFTGITVIQGTGTYAVGTWVMPVNAGGTNWLICDATFTGSTKGVRHIGNRFYRNTDTGSALDGVIQGKCIGNEYEENLLGVGIGWSNAEGSGAADSDEEILVEGNTILGPNQASVESQGIKAAKYNPSGGDGGNNRAVIIKGNTIRLCDRSLWLDTLDDSLVEGNILRGAVGPNRQHVLLGTTGETVNRLTMRDNHLHDASVGIRVDVTNNVVDLVLEDNHFHTDVTTKISGTLHSSAKTRNNMGYNGTFAVDDITVTASPMTYTAGATPEVIFIHTNASGTTTIRKESGGVILHETVTVAQRMTFPLEPGETLHITYGSAPTRFSRYRK